MNKIQIKRLTNVAVALEDAAKNEELAKAFSMLFYGWNGKSVINGYDIDYRPILGEPKHKCGTPACAIGNYAARKDLQKTFKLFGPRAGEPGTLASNGSKVLTIESDKVLNHFGITTSESTKLFSSYGCGNAKTPLAAAKFIRKFIKEKTAK